MDEFEQLMDYRRRFHDMRQTIEEMTALARGTTFASLVDTLSTANELIGKDLARQIERYLWPCEW